MITWFRRQVEHQGLSFYLWSPLFSVQFLFHHSPSTGLYLKVKVVLNFCLFRLSVLESLFNILKKSEDILYIKP